MTRWAPFVVVAAMATLSTTLGVASSAGAAAECGADSVSVIVEQGALGGGDLHDCRPAGDDAATLLEDVGLELDYVQQQPTFICRVDGRPADDPCVVTPPQDAYWGLWWSDGETPTWRYASVAASGLTVPAGGAVALAWQDTPERVPPDAPAVAGQGQTSADSGPSAAPSDTGPEPAADGSGLPAWVGPVAVLVLVAAATTTVLLRRARG